MENTEQPSRNARRKSEVPMDVAMLCKKETYNPSRFQEIVRKSDASNKFLKTQYACFVEAHESTRQRLESSLPKNHGDHIAGKGYNSMTHYNLVHKFIPMPQAMKIPCLVTKHDADANDNIYDCVVLHDANANDNIHDCVALHDANTNDHFH